MTAPLDTSKTDKHGDALLEVRGLSVDFGSPKGRIHALRDISLTVKRGRITGIVGCRRERQWQIHFGLRDHPATGR